MEIKQEPLDSVLVENINFKQETIYLTPYTNIKIEQTDCKYENQLELPTKAEYEDCLITPLNQVDDIDEVSARDYFVKVSDFVQVKQEPDFSKPTTEVLSHTCAVPKPKTRINYLYQPSTSKQSKIIFKQSMLTSLRKGCKKKKKYLCPVCGKRFMSSKPRKNHFALHFKRRCAICRACGKYFTKPQEYLNHYFIYFIKKRLRPKFASKSIEEFVIKPNKRFSCKICPSTFKLKYSLKYHVLFKHLGEKPYQCEFCNKTFGHKSYLVNHIPTHTGEKPYICFLCSRPFAKRQYLKYHLKTHAQERPFECDFCFKKFSQKASVIDHRRIHTGEKPYVCDVCSKAFSRKHELRRHSLVHTGIHPYKCDICLKAFKKRDNLKLHILNHTGEKPFKCETCSKEFKGKHNLKIHLRVHTGERPYMCEICSKSFKLKPTLNQHLKSHDKSVKPFKCDICFKEFTRRSGVTSHYRTHTKEKRYKCEICSVGYAAKITLRKHNALVHPLTVSTIEQEEVIIKNESEDFSNYYPPTELWGELQN